jgi:hypothetical protein
MVPRFPGFPHPRRPGTEFWVSPQLSTPDRLPMRLEGFPSAHLPAFPRVRFSDRLDFSSRFAALPSALPRVQMGGFPRPSSLGARDRWFSGFPRIAHPPALPASACVGLPAQLLLAPGDPYPSGFPSVRIQRRECLPVFGFPRPLRPPAPSMQFRVSPLLASSGCVAFGVFRVSPSSCLGNGPMTTPPFCEPCILGRAADESSLPTGLAHSGPALDANSISNRPPADGRAAFRTSVSFDSASSCRVQTAFPRPLRAIS